MLKLIILKFFLILSMGAFASSHIVVLNSLPNNLSVRYLGSVNNYIEKKFKAAVNGSDYSLEFIHDAELVDYLNLLQMNHKPIVFWIGHGSAKFSTATHKMTITDSEDINISKVLSELDHEFPYFSVVTCDSEEIMSGNQDIETISGKMSLGNALKVAIDKFSNKVGMRKECSWRRIHASKRRTRECRNIAEKMDALNITRNQTKKDTKQLEYIEANITGLKHTKYKTLQVLVNSTLIRVIRREDYKNKYVIKIPKDSLFTKKRNEIIISSGEIYLNKDNFNLDSVSIEIKGTPLEQFDLNGVKTLKGNILFYYSLDHY